MQRRVVVTGAAGFLGSHLCEHLCAEGRSVVGIDNLCRGSTDALASLCERDNFHLITADIRDQEAVMRASRNAGVLVHLAASRGPDNGPCEETLSVNLEGTESVLEAARQVGARVVYGSTTEVYGKACTEPITEDSALVFASSPSGRWDDIVSKACAEHLCLAYVEEYGLECALVRYGSIYGPRHRLDRWAEWPAILIRQALQGENATLHGEARRLHTLLYVEDAVRATLKAIDTDGAGRDVISLTGAEEITLAELGALVWEVAGRTDPYNPDIRPCTENCPCGAAISARFADGPERMRMLDLPPFQSLRCGLERTIVWQREQDSRKERL
jgi:UDP-glucose 4-epimerase